MVIPALDWAVWTVLLPLFGAAAAFVGNARAGPWIGLLVSLAVILCSAGLALDVFEHGVRRHDLGGWGAPLGIGLVADGLAAAMLVTTAVVGALAGLHATGHFAPRPGDDAEQAAARARRRRHFWPLWLFMWAALDALYLSADLFNLYVTLELLGLAAVPLVALAGGPSLAAAMRYLLVSMLGSLSWLFGVALLYGHTGSLALEQLRQVPAAGPALAIALAMMIGGALLKTALFPLHFWLPSAHAGAPAPISALLSAVVVKATFYLVLRLWALAVPTALAPAAGQLLGYLGAAAILWGGVVALRQPRIKLILAYSTVSQLGYLFLAFALAGAPGAGAGVWSAAVLLVAAHAFSKAALFLASGNIILALGHDRIDGLQGAGARLPISLFAFGLAGMNLLGLPPGGAFLAKWNLLIAALRAGAWELVVVMMAGGLLAAAYLVRVLAPALMGPGSEPRIAVPAVMQWSALVLAMLGVLLAVAAPAALALLEVGSPFAASAGGSP